MLDTKNKLNVLKLNTEIYENSQREIDYIYRDSLGFYKLEKIVGLIGLIVGLIYSWGKLNVPPNTGLGKILMKLPLIILLLLVLSGGIILSTVLVLIVTFLRKKTNDILRNKRLNSNKEKLRLLGEKCKVSSGFIQSSDVLPDKYKYNHAVSHIISYLETMRADNIKEAINLYETELRAFSDSEKLNEIVRLSQQAVEASQRAEEYARQAEANSRYYWMYY